jgi:hypothetical protein
MLLLPTLLSADFDRGLDRSLLGQEAPLEQLLLGVEAGAGLRVLSCLEMGHANGAIGDLAKSVQVKIVIV